MPLRWLGKFFLNNLNSPPCFFLLLFITWTNTIYPHSCPKELWNINIFPMQLMGPPCQRFWWRRAAQWFCRVITQWSTTAWATSAGDGIVERSGATTSSYKQMSMASSPKSQTGTSSSEMSCQDKWIWGSKKYRRQTAGRTAVEWT